MKIDQLSKIFTKSSTKGLLAFVTVVAFASTVISLAIAQECYEGADVVAAPSGAQPVFCMLTSQGNDTSKSYANAWVDDFEHGVTMANLEGTNYREFELGEVDSVQWRHNNHWMADMVPTYGDGSRGAKVLSPNQTFKFEDGKFIVESTYAAAIEEYDGEAWGEIVISTGDTPRSDYFYDLYTYGQFPNEWTFGLRLQDDRVPIAAFFVPAPSSKSDDPQIDRVYEISFWQVPTGATSEGGGPWGEAGDIWRSCAEADPDINCRDKFRLELTKDSVTLYVQNQSTKEFYKYFAQTNLPDFSSEFTNGDLSVYLSSTMYRPTREVYRFHWDEIVINPHSSSIEEGPIDPPGGEDGGGSDGGDDGGDTEGEETVSFTNFVLDLFNVQPTAKNLAIIEKVYILLESKLK